MLAITVATFGAWWIDARLRAAAGTPQRAIALGGIGLAIGTAIVALPLSVWPSQPTTPSVSPPTTALLSLATSPACLSPELAADSAWSAHLLGPEHDLVLLAPSASHDPATEPATADLYRARALCVLTRAHRALRPAGRLALEEPGDLYAAAARSLWPDSLWRVTLRMGGDTRNYLITGSDTPDWLSRLPAEIVRVCPVE